MSQMCRSPQGGPNPSRNTSQGSMSKAADDSHERITHSKDEKQRSRSRNKIPKNLRYDLQNSLISLCDVWFENIKPHLVRNNIKLHMNDNEVDPGAACSSGSGDSVLRHPPISPSHCTHVDPGAAPHRQRQSGANYAGFSSTLLTASKAPCLRPPVPACRQRRAPHPGLSPIQSQRLDQDQRQAYKAMQDQRPYTIAVHINKNVKKPETPPPNAGERLPRLSKMVPLGEAKRVSRPCNMFMQPLWKKTLHDEEYSYELFKSTIEKAAAVGLHLDSRRPGAYTTRQFQKVIKKNFPRINEQRKLS